MEGLWGKGVTRVNACTVLVAILMLWPSRPGVEASVFCIGVERAVQLTGESLQVVCCGDRLGMSDERQSKHDGCYR